MLQSLIHGIRHGYAARTTGFPVGGLCLCAALASKAALPLKERNSSPGCRIATCSNGRGTEENSQNNKRKSRRANH